MQHHNRRMMIAALFAAALLLSACTQTTTASTQVQPVTLEKIEGSELNRVILTDRAAQRLDIQTAAVQELAVDGAQQKSVPYAALIYDLHGETWIYTNPAPLTYVRQAVSVSHIDGDNAVLTDGPDLGTAVVVVGVAELYGADTGVGK